MPYPDWKAGQTITAGLLRAAQPLHAIKLSDTARATDVLSDDPDLTFQLAANARYKMHGFIHFSTTDAGTADLNVDWTVPSGATGRWTGFGQPVGATSGEGGIRTVSTIIGNSRTFGALTDTGSPLTILLSSTITTTNAGTYALQWARQGASGTVTLYANSHLLLHRTD